MIEWSAAMVDFMKGYHETNRQFLDDFAYFPSGHLGMVNEIGGLDLYDGKLRAIDSDGKRTLDDISTNLYQEYFAEAVSQW